MSQSVSSFPIQGARIAFWLAVMLLYIIVEHRILSMWMTPPGKLNPAIESYASSNLLAMDAIIFLFLSLCIDRVLVAAAELNDEYAQRQH